MKEEIINNIIHGDALEVLSIIDDGMIDVVVTDPPYFLDKLDNHWRNEIVSSAKYHHTVKSLPAGMKFDREQGKRLYEWYSIIAREIYRVLKPGGFFFSFSSPRLYHRMTSAVDDAGFLIRDCFIWLYTQNQPKAMGLNHFIEKLQSNTKAKTRLKEMLNGWKTPQIKSCFEPIMVAQKQYEGTLLDNMVKYKVGLFNTNLRVGDGMFPSNVMVSEEFDNTISKYFLVSKPTKKEKGEYNIHKTVKPLAICEYLIQLSTFDNNAIVLDPFIGSGTTAVAAKRLGRKFIGIETNLEYIKIAHKRLHKLTVEGNLQKKAQGAIFALQH
ncbi:MAG: site-specific DNA-methyltransferase [Candidatus Portnoybacteria bacterium]|nr:site-specific DNA-methyltransferase [Candidatus Portnoybacteria bacterium]